MHLDSTTTFRKNQLVLNRRNLEALSKAHGIKSDSDLARRLGVNASTLFRIQSGKTKPSNEFIAGVKAAFPMASLDDLFTVQPVA